MLAWRALPVEYRAFILSTLDYKAFSSLSLFFPQNNDTKIPFMDFFFNRLDQYFFFLYEIGPGMSLKAFLYPMSSEEH